MKKLMFITVCAIVLTSGASQVKMSDLFVGNPSLTNGNWKESYEITNIPKRVATWDEYGRIVEYAKNHPETKQEFEDYFMRIDNGFNFFIKNGVDFPKAFTNKINLIAKNYPITASSMLKYNNVDLDFRKMDLEELLAIYPEYFKHVDWLNAEIQTKCVIILKRYLFEKNIGVAVYKDETGKEVNPLAGPMTELADALNSPRLNGLNEWFVKYANGKYTVDLSTLPDETKISEIMDSIVIGKKRLTSDVSATLRKCLGVEKYNEFVDKFNGKAK